MNKEQFIKEICDKFPYLKDEILDEDYGGLFSLQVSVFRENTQSAIDNCNNEVIETHLNFISKNFKSFDNEVENSIVLSYIGKLDFKNYPMPKLFQDIQAELAIYNQSAHKDETLIKVLKKISKEK
jgi:hypothetical protein